MDAAPATDELSNLPATRKHNVIKMGREIKVYRQGVGFAQTPNESHE